MYSTRGCDFERVLKWLMNFLFVVFFIGHFSIDSAPVRMRAFGTFCYESLMAVGSDVSIHAHPVLVDCFVA